MSRRRKIVESSSEDDSSSEEEYTPPSTARRKSGSQAGASSQKSQHRKSIAGASGSSYSSSQATSSQQGDLSQSELSRCAGLVANYLLAAEGKKIPVKRSDLSKVVGKQHTRRLPDIVQQASSLLLKVYGYKVVELERRKLSYILVNQLAAPLNCPVARPLGTSPDADDTEDDREQELLAGVEEEPGSEKEGLLYCLLTVIFMMGGVVEEVTMLSFLKCLGVYVESNDSHPVLGNCKKLIDEFTKQSYLEVTIHKDLEPVRKEYAWGERAELQVCKRAILEFVCKVYGGGMRPEDWADHWRKIVGTGSPSSTSGSSVEEIMDVDPR